MNSSDRRFLALDTLPAACAAVMAVVLVVLPIAGSIAYFRNGVQGLGAAAVAAVVCWLGATLALVVTDRCQGGEKSVYGVFLAIFFRTGFPLIAAVLLGNGSRWLSEGGIFAAILMFYLPTLAAETYLSVRLINAARQVSGHS